MKEIEGFPDYFIDETGHVYSQKSGTLKELKQGTDHDGYKTIGLYNHGVAKRIKTHKLVANAFIPKDPNRLCINHKDGNKANNSVENLEWCTPQENSMHAYNNGLLNYGRAQRLGVRAKARYSEEDIRYIKEMYSSGMSQREIGSIVGCDHSVISEIVTGKIYKPIE